MALYSDNEVFGNNTTKKLLSDEDVFGPPDGPLKRGWEQAKGSAAFMANLATGDNQAAAQNIVDSTAYRMRNPGMPEGKQLGEAWESGNGILGGIEAVGGEIAKDWREAPNTVDALKGAGRNARAMGEGIAEQVPNMLAPTMGMVAGGASGSYAGSVVPGVGTTVGALTGAFLGSSAGNALVEGQEIAMSDLQKSGVDVSDINAISQHLQENSNELLKKAGIKGSVIGVVDTAMTALTGGILNKPARMATFKILGEMGVDLTDKAAVKTAMGTEPFEQMLLNDAAYQASQKGVKNVARNVTAAALDPIGEGAGEYLGTGLATGDYDAKNAALEAFSSVGQSGAMFAGQKAYQRFTRPQQAEGQPGQPQESPTPPQANPAAPDQAPFPTQEPPPPYTETVPGPETLQPPAQPVPTPGPISRAADMLARTTPGIMGKVMDPAMAPLPEDNLAGEWNAQEQQALADNQKRNALGATPVQRAGLMGKAAAGVDVDPDGIDSVLNEASFDRNYVGGEMGKVKPETSLLAQGASTPRQQRAEREAEYQEVFSGPTLLSDAAEQRLAVLERQMSDGEVGQRFQRDDTFTADGQAVPGEWDGVKSTNPEWLKSGLLKEVGKAGIRNVIDKVRRGDKLTNRQAGIWSEIKKVADKEYENDPATVAAKTAEEIQREHGIELQPAQNIPVGNLQEGDKVVVEGKNGIPDVVTHKGMDRDGKAILQDGVTVHADPWDMVPAMGVKHNEDKWVNPGRTVAGEGDGGQAVGPVNQEQRLPRDISATQPAEITGGTAEYLQGQRERRDFYRGEPAVAESDAQGFIRDQQGRQSFQGVDNTPQSVAGNPAEFLRDQGIRRDAMGTVSEPVRRQPGESTRDFLKRRKAGREAGGESFDVGHASDAAYDQPQNAAIREAWTRAHMVQDSDGTARRMQHDHFDEWHAGGGVSSAVGSQYDAHGIAKSNPLGALLNLLQNGIDTTRRFDTAPLVTNSGTSAGLGAASGAYKDGPFIILGKKGKELKEGIHTVLVSDAVSGVIPQLQQRFPGVRFVKYSEAQATLENDSANVSPNQKNEPQADLSPTGETQSPATRAKPAQTSDNAGDVKAKEPWEMTSAEYVESKFYDEAEKGISKGSGVEYRRKHEASVRSRLDVEHYDLSEKAFMDGKPVPLKNRPNWSLTSRQVAERSDDTLDSYIKAAHREEIEAALSENKPVPAAVLADYPDLAKQHGKQPAQPTLKTNSTSDLPSVGTETAPSKGEASTNPPGNPTVKESLTVQETTADDFTAQEMETEVDFTLFETGDGTPIRMPAQKAIDIIDGDLAIYAKLLKCVGA